MRNLYLLSRKKRGGYGTYDSCVVVAASEEEALRIHPDGEQKLNTLSSTWPADSNDIDCKLLGFCAYEYKYECGEVVIAFFNAG